MIDLDKNEKLKIIASNIENSTIADLVSQENSKLLIRPRENNFKKGEDVEIFSKVDGINCYFKARLFDVENSDITAEITENFSILKKREFKRVPVNLLKNISLNDENYQVVLLDISLNGMKFSSFSKLEIGQKYDFSIFLESKNSISCEFFPLRIDYEQDNNSFQISGKFENLQKIDRIKLFQFCMKIDMENMYK